MNAEEILNMQAGTKINQLIWWKIFDMTPEPPNNDMLLLPDYSGDICAAWQIVNKLESRPEGFRAVYYRDVNWQNGGQGWYACFEGQAVKGVFAETAPLAICRAALLATVNSTN